MKQFTLLLVALAALLGVVACTPSGGQEPIAAAPTEATEPTTAAEEPTIMEENALQGVRWVLVSYLNAAGETVTALADREVTAEFRPDGQMGGNGGCNQYFAGYTVDGGNLTISQAGSTMMACEPVEIMDQEAQFLTALTTAAAWQMNGEQLVILNAAGDAVVTFQAAAEQSLAGTSWSAVNINIGTAVSTLLPDTVITATFGEDGQLTGSAGCNNYFASYTVDGGNLTIGQAGSTMMACEPAEIMTQETAYLTSLANAATWSIENGQLRILDAEGSIVAVFDPVTAASLTGTTWAATGINTGTQAVSSLVADTTITATFTEDGKLNGSAGCNNFMTSYTLDGANITIQPAATTRKMCPGEGVMEQETRFLTALTTAATWRIDGDTLELRTADDALAASFVIQPAQ